jgi:hypothetical protein
MRTHKLTFKLTHLYLEAACHYIQGLYCLLYPKHTRYFQRTYAKQAGSINKAATEITDFFSSVLLPPLHTAVLHNTGEVSACECASKVEMPIAQVHQENMEKGIP